MSLLVLPGKCWEAADSCESTLLSVKSLFRPLVPLEMGEKHQERSSQQPLVPSPLHPHLARGAVVKPFEKVGDEEEKQEHEYMLVSGTTNDEPPSEVF